MCACFVLSGKQLDKPRFSVFYPKILFELCLHVCWNTQYLWEIKNFNFNLAKSLCMKFLKTKFIMIKPLELPSLFLFLEHTVLGQVFYARPSINLVHNLQGVSGLF